MNTVCAGCLKESDHILPYKLDPRGTHRQEDVVGCELCSDCYFLGEEGFTARIRASRAAKQQAGETITPKPVEGSGDAATREGAVAAPSGSVRVGTPQPSAGAAPDHSYTAFASNVDYHVGRNIPKGCRVVSDRGKRGVYMCFVLDEHGRELAHEAYMQPPHHMDLERLARNACVKWALRMRMREGE